LAAPENKGAADSFLTGLKSYGETDVYKALEAVLSEPTRPGVPDIVLVMTDGRPTADRSKRGSTPLVGETGDGRLKVTHLDNFE
jgi:hypothetical protein